MRRARSTILSVVLNSVSQRRDAQRATQGHRHRGRQSPSRKHRGRTRPLQLPLSMYEETREARVGPADTMEGPRSASFPEQLTALASVGEELAAGATLADGFQRAMRLLDQRLGAKHAALVLAEGDQRPLGVDMAYGIVEGALRPRHGDGVAGRVVQSGLPIVVPSMAR